MKRILSRAIVSMLALALAGESAAQTRPVTTRPEEVTTIPGGKQTGPAASVIAQRRETELTALERRRTELAQELAVKERTEARPMPRVAEDRPVAVPPARTPEALELRRELDRLDLEIEQRQREVAATQKEDQRKTEASAVLRPRENGGSGAEATLPTARLLAIGVGRDEREALAAALARQRGAPLQRVELSAVASKYVGETEKNLARVLAEAEKAGAVLFFDEADALFGKRTDVKDSHDRYANTEVSYLLQRLEEASVPVVIGLKNEKDPALDPVKLKRWSKAKPRP